MEPAEISLLLLRHLARDGCVETIRTYVNECPAVMQSLTVASGGGAPDLEFFRQKLLNRSVNMSLSDLLSEYGRAKSMIQDLVSKLLFDWKALSTYFLSPHDSMATQLAHITNLLESKCKSCRTDWKCVGTSDDPGFSGSGTSGGVGVRKEGMDVGVQTAEEVENVVEIPEEPSDIPTIVSSLLDPPMIEKIVEIANREKLNRSNQSENVLANDTETEIDKMLLDILHGMGGSNPIPSNALNAGCNSGDSAAPEQSAVDPQLMDLFQYAQSTIVHTPVPGTLVRPEDSVSKQRPCGSFLDLIDTPFKSAFLSVPNTPAEKVITQNEADKPAEKPIQTVELNFGPSASISGGTSDLSSIHKPNVSVGFITKPKSGPKYTIVCGSETQIPVPVSQDLQKVRKKRDITPRIPPTFQTQPGTTSETATTSTASLIRSASKRKFNTPVKLSPVKALLAPSVNFYCPSSSFDKVSSASKSELQTSSIETPLKLVPALGFSSITTPVTSREPLTAPPVSEASVVKSPLSTINYQDLVNSEMSKNSSSTNQAVAESREPAVGISSAKAKQTPVSGNSKTMAANMMTPDFDLTEKSLPNENPDVSPTPVYSRLLASVRHARPSSVLLRQKSFSTPRKKGHIRNLMFKTPPSAHSERTESSIFSETISGKRKATPSPPLGNKSKKRLKWNNLVDTKNDSSSVNDESTPVPATHALPATIQPPTSQIMADIASKIVGQNVVGTRSRSTRNSQANANLSQKPTRQTRGSTSKKKEKSPNVSNEVVPGSTLVSPPAAPVVSPPTVANSRRSSKRLDDQRAADAAVLSAVPLGLRNLPTSRSRVTRGKSKLENVEQVDQKPVDTRSSIWMTQMDVKNVEAIPPPSGFGDSSSADSHYPAANSVRCAKISNNLNPQDSDDRHSIGSAKPVQESKTRAVTNLQAPDNPSEVVGLVNQTPSEEKTVGGKRHQTRTNKDSIGVQNRVVTEISKECVKIKPKPVDVSVGGASCSKPTSVASRSEGLTLSDHFEPQQVKRTPFPNLMTGLSSAREASASKTVSNSGNVLASDSTTGDVKSARTPCSPSRGRPRSPRKSPNKNPRRILPKPVPPDHPRPVFPPPSQNSGYMLSIPSSSPTSNNDDSLSILRTFSSPISLASETPLKKPSLTLSSSDSSVEISNSVPKTPRLKNDSGDDNTTSRMFLGLRNDSISVGAGIPIFSSTPIKFPPETPGKNLPVGGGAVIIEGDTCTRTSLFDTPIKVDSPPKSVSSLQLHREPSKGNHSTKTVEFSSNLSLQSVIPRKSPRKSNSPLKSRVKTPRKAKTPMKSVQKLPAKTSFEYKPTRRTPYKSPLSKKITGSPCHKAAEEQEKASTGTENQAFDESPAVSKSEVKDSTAFSTLCTKSRSLMRLSEVARRGKANLSTNSLGSSTPALSSPNVATVSKSEKTNGKSAKSADVHFQFAVSGRTKQLSLSEHESLIGLLQIGSIKTQQKKQSRSIQKLDSDLLSNIDLHKFLRSVHAGE